LFSDFNRKTFGKLYYFGAEYRTLIIMYLYCLSWAELNSA